MKFDSNNHSVFLMYDHLVLVVKYRRKVIDGAISDYARDKFVSLGERYNIALIEWNHDIDHIHILFKAQPNSELSKFINVYKSEVQDSSKRIFPTFGKSYGKKCFGQEVFVKAYIENQGTK